LFLTSFLSADRGVLDANLRLKCAPLSPESHQADRPLIEYTT
jgi:hypothetical protein